MVLKKEPAGIPLSLVKDRAGGPLQKNFSCIFLSLYNRQQLLLSFAMESSYLEKETAIQDWSEDVISFITPAEKGNQLLCIAVCTSFLTDCSFSQQISTDDLISHTLIMSIT